MSPVSPGAFLGVTDFQEHVSPVSRVSPQKVTNCEKVALCVGIAAVCCSLVRKNCVNRGEARKGTYSQKRVENKVWGWVDSNHRIPK